MLLGRGEVGFLRGVGYQHDAARHCPSEHREDSTKDHKGDEADQRIWDNGGGGRCACEPTPLDENFYKLVPMESPQKKPADTCIRRWLGGEWLRKREGWRREVEVAVGGDGSGGYVLG
ncbi:uncharacterized protein AB675_11871 [Cyphellophora attinorum]|uniref:Uncharacterized protein n=1 Tax=Cyphellophora attinorum TaxID=1664694 RepID=A0A0N1H576_9EURO|nr:uncharacterized protein AB675_11871 [Phialophora attinorum]KPI36805.1 hypothetical protein AB675_11871 [Phialophora attinorum]